MKRAPIWLHKLLILTVLFTAFPVVAHAEDPPYRVARLNFSSGSVSLQPAGVDDWTAAYLNRPLTTGDRLYTDEGSRAELHIGSAALRLSGQTSMSFLNLDDHTTQLQLSEGTLAFRVRRLDEDDWFEVDTPNLAFSVLRPGEYRVDASPDGESTIVTVFSGEGQVTGGGQAFTLYRSQQARVSGTDSIEYDVRDEPRRDGFDNWCVSRDVREDRARSARYVSPNMIGYEDLDDYGRWETLPGYGPVWTPIAVAPGWAPYRYGHWAWIAPWGWTWVDDAPWGFAPFHYGRWAFVGNGWVWVPGPVVMRPVYSPALVVFVGGPRFAASLSFGGGGGVGWFPLAPGEPYVPAYRASPTYITNVNNTTITNTTIINNVTVNNYHYANQTVPGAVTAVPTQTFVSAKPVAASAVKVPPTAAQTAQVAQAAPVAPAKTSVLGPAPATASVPKPATEVVNRAVVAKNAPPPPPVPFAKQQQALAAQPGRPLESEALTRIQPPPAAHPAVRIAPPAAVSKAPVQPAKPPAAGVQQAAPTSPPASAAPSAPGNPPSSPRAPSTPPQPSVVFRPQQPSQQQVERERRDQENLEKQQEEREKRALDERKKEQQQREQEQLKKEQEQERKAQQEHQPNTPERQKPPQQEAKQPNQQKQTEKQKKEQQQKEQKEKESPKPPEPKPPLV